VIQQTLLALEGELQRFGEIFNVGTGEGVTIEEIAAQITNHQEHLGARPGEQLQSRAISARSKSSWAGIPGEGAGMVETPALN